MQVIDALASFPLAVDKDRLPNIYQLAPTTKESLGNTAYLIVRPGKGNVMIDVPRWGFPLSTLASRKLRVNILKFSMNSFAFPPKTFLGRFLKKTAANIEALGGVKYLIVTARNNAIGA